MTVITLHHSAVTNSEYLGSTKKSKEGKFGRGNRNDRNRLCYPVLLTGDFNSTAGSDVFALLTQGGVYHGLGDTLTRDLGIADSCEYIDTLMRNQEMITHSGTYFHNFGFRCTQSAQYEVNN